MASFFTNCPQCGVSFPKGGPCPDCHWSENGAAVATAEAGTATGQDSVAAFAELHRVHIRNYVIFMVMTFSTGFMGLLTAYMWFRLIYFGQAVAFLLIGVLTVATGGLTMLSVGSKNIFPTDLNCPSCNSRLDELGMNIDYCPCCSTHLR